MNLAGSWRALRSALVVVGGMIAALCIPALCIPAPWIAAAQGAEQPAAKVSRPPNIIFILVDDFGWTDLGCYGSKLYETPNIDRLANEGMRFTNAYAACTVCSPTRAAVMTGKYPARLHLTDWIAGHNRPNAKLQIPDWTKFLPLKETTIAEALKPAGYTTASIGKWHLGGDGFEPTRQGFDVNIGGTHIGQPPSYFFPYSHRANNNKKKPRPDVILPGLEKGQPGEYLTDRLGDETIRFITENKDRPFYIYLPQYAVHTPLQAKPELVARYQAKVDPNAPQHNPVYAAMIDSLDQCVGRIMDHLASLNLVDNTVVVFTGDNGGLVLNEVTSNVPLRAGKGSAYEGGVREPLIVRYPPLVKAGTTCDEPVTTVDFYPTLLELAGTKADAKATLDGVSIAGLLKDSGATLDREAIYWHYPHYHPGGATPYSAIRAGDYRLVEFFEDGHVELYDLKDDIGETTDLAAQLPQKRDELQKKLSAWRDRVGAQLPTPNPNYKP